MISALKRFGVRTARSMPVKRIPSPGASTSLAMRPPASKAADLKLNKAGRLYNKRSGKLVRASSPVSQAGRPRYNRKANRMTGPKGGFTGGPPVGASVPDATGISGVRVRPSGQRTARTSKNTATSWWSDRTKGEKAGMIGAGIVIGGSIFGD